MSVFFKAFTLSSLFARRPNPGKPVGEGDRLGALPPELHMMIGDYLAPVDKYNLSRTSKGYHHFIEDAFFGNAMANYPSEARKAPSKPQQSRFESLRVQANYNKAEVMHAKRALTDMCAPRGCISARAAGMHAALASDPRVAQRRTRCLDRYLKAKAGVDYAKGKQHSVK